MTEEQQKIHGTLTVKLFKNSMVLAADTDRFEGYWPLEGHDGRSETNATISCLNRDFLNVCSVNKISNGLNFFDAIQLSALGFLALIRSRDS